MPQKKVEQGSKLVEHYRTHPGGYIKTIHTQRKFHWGVAKAPEAPMRAEFLQKRLISAFFGFQWKNLAEILHLFKKYIILKVAE